MAERLSGAMRATRALVVAAGLAGAGAAVAAPGPAGPGSCRRVPPGEPLQPVLDAAPAGAAVCLAAGRHAGPLRIDTPLELRGEAGAWIVSQGAGSTLTVAAPGAVVADLGIDGSGGRFDRLDAALRIEADRVRVEGVRIENALFGILAEQCAGLRIEHTVIRGDPSRSLGMRGDGIRLWEVRDSLVAHNRLRHSRDLVVWYSPGNRFVGNRVEGSRYGTHFMYSHRNRVEEGRFDGNVVGIFAMYSRDLVLRGNRILRSGGAAGMGLGAKESGGLTVEGNHLVGNTTGLYLDTSPLQEDAHNRFAGNRIAGSGTAVVFHGVARRNHFRGNDFRGNRRLLRMEGRGHARDATWHGNRYDGYRGYDLDGDGVGDLPFRLRSLSQQLAAGRPALAFFEGTAAFEAVEWLGRLVPLLRPRVLMEDPAPRVALELEAP